MTDAYVAVQNLRKNFDRHPVLAGIDASVRPGDVVGLLGANGAGKTTFIELLLGLSPPSSGNVQLFGADAIKATTAIKERIGFVPQSDELIAQLSGRQYLDLIASFYPAWDFALADRLVAEWGIELGKTIANYSLGQRQKLSIVTALAHQPDLLVLDEPVASLDPVARRQFLQQIVRVSSDARRAVVFSSHIVSDVERLANVIWILKDGRLFWQGELDTLKESVVRIHVRGDAVAQVRAKLARVVAERAAGDGVRLIAIRAPDEDWSSLEELVGPGVRIERLGLEDIFVELHS